MVSRAGKRPPAWAGEGHLVASGAKLLKGCHAGDKGLIIEEGVCTAQQILHSIISIHRPHKSFRGRRVFGKTARKTSALSHHLYYDRKLNVQPDYEGLEAHRPID